jgi:YhcH/YjgK/YiaL family protein
MITARLGSMASLEMIPPSLREAARLLVVALASAPLPEGRSRLGDFDLIVSEPGSAASGELPFESHRRFIDLQAVLEGTEIFEVARLADCRVTKPYESEGDAELYASAAASRHLLLLEAGDAVVFFPEDAHKPRVAAPGVRARLRKAVVKVPVDPEAARQ